MVVIEVYDGMIHLSWDEISYRLASWPDPGYGCVLSGRIVCRIEPPR